MYDEGYLQAYLWASSLAAGAALPQEATALPLGPSEIAHARSAWIEAGRPLVQESTNGLLGRHPLWRVLLESEAHAARFRAELGLSPRSAKAAIGRRPGRPSGAASSPDRVRLRTVD